MNDGVNKRNQERSCICSCLHKDRDEENTKLTNFSTGNEMQVTYFGMPTWKRVQSAHWDERRRWHQGVRGDCGGESAWQPWLNDTQYCNSSYTVKIQQHHLYKNKKSRATT